MPRHNSFISTALGLIAAVCVAMTAPSIAAAAPREITFAQSADVVDAYDLVEITARVAAPDVSNPFTGAALAGWFERTDGNHRWQVEGFCDAEDGSVYRIRFMLPSPGEYRYTFVYKQGSFEKASTESFRARDSHRRGPIRVDPVVALRYE
ncbi:MAG TPA: DUF5060 domain-containing protein [Terriglobia bacterium]|nr:DUF5060 domain-containing protein [Terriglobia bacterium]